MASVSEQLVREYFETAGCLVRTPIKYQVAARRKRPEEEIDLLIWNPFAADDHQARGLVWSEADVHHCRRALVCVRGWHSERLTPAVLQDSPDFFRFTSEEVRQLAEQQLDGGPVCCLLCVPNLPAGRPLREQVEGLLSEHDVDGVLLFPTMLMEMIRRVDRKSNYEPSTVLQILRILKQYRLLRDPQLDLFSHRRRSRRSKREDG